jgi:hypothetical protein
MTDPYESLLFQNYTEAEIREMLSLMTEWDLATYTTIAHSVVDNGKIISYGEN